MDDYCVQAYIGILLKEGLRSRGETDPKKESEEETRRAWLRERRKLRQGVRPACNKILTGALRTPCVTQREL